MPWPGWAMSSRAGTSAWQSSAAPWLGVEPLDDPRAVVARVAEAIVQPVVPVLPELPGLGNDAKTAPGLRPLDIRFCEFRCATFQLCSVAEDCALARRPCSGARACRRSRKIRVRLLRGNALNGAFDAHLATERVPVEEQRRVRIHLELAP